MRVVDAEAKPLSTPPLVNVVGSWTSRAAEQGPSIKLIYIGVFISALLATCGHGRACQTKTVTYYARFKTNLITKHKNLQCPSVDSRLSQPWPCNLQRPKWVCLKRQIQAIKIGKNIIISTFKELFNNPWYSLPTSQSSHPPDNKWKMHQWMIHTYRIFVLQYLIR